MRNRTYPIALGGMLAAASVVIMSVGTIVPVATYAAPVVCMMVGQVVLKLCGSRIAWAWYAAVTILSALLAPDKEAAAVFAVLGYYPILKPKLDGKKAKWLWKALFFNGSILLLYWAALTLLGIRQLDILQAQHLGYLHILPLLHNLIHAPAHHAEATQSDFHWVSSLFNYALSWFLYVGALAHPVSLLRWKPWDFQGGYIF